MLTQLLLHKHDPLWERFFGPDIEPTVYNYSTFINSSGNIYVSEVSFYNFTDGVIRLLNFRLSNLLICKSFFYNSYRDNDGGAIYFEDGESCFQYRVCSINSNIPCNPAMSGAHSYVRASQKNYIIESSISKTVGWGYSIVNLEGDQLIDSTNISYAKCVRFAAYICSDSMEDSIEPSPHLANFTSIFNNTVDDWGVIYHLNKNQHCIYRCNVINNINKQYGIVYSLCEFLHISYCVFSSNSGRYLFDVEEGTLIVDKSFLDNNINFYTLEGGIDVRIKTTKKLVLNLHHLSTQQCIDFPVNIEFYPETSHVENPYQNYDRLKLIPR